MFIGYKFYSECYRYNKEYSYMEDVDTGGRIGRESTYIERGMVQKWGK